MAAEEFSYYDLDQDVNQEFITGEDFMLNGQRYKSNKTSPSYSSPAQIVNQPGPSSKREDVNQMDFIRPTNLQILPILNFNAPVYEDIRTGSSSPVLSSSGSDSSSSGTLIKPL